MLLCLLIYMNAYQTCMWLSLFHGNQCIYSASVCLSWSTPCVCLSVPLPSLICVLLWPLVQWSHIQANTQLHAGTHCLSLGSPCVWPPCRGSRWIAPVCVSKSMCVCECVVDAWPVPLPAAIWFPSHYFMFMNITKTLVPSFLSQSVPFSRFSHTSVSTLSLRVSIFKVNWNAKKECIWNTVCLNYSNQHVVSPVHISDFYDFCPVQLLS